MQPNSSAVGRTTSDSGSHAHSRAPSAHNATPSAQLAKSNAREQTVSQFFLPRSEQLFEQDLDEDGNPLLMEDYVKGTPEIISQCNVRTIPCLKCGNRLGYSERTALHAKCSHCGFVSEVAAAKRKEKNKKKPPRVPHIDAIVQCMKCRQFLGVPQDVSTFQCGNCRQVNVAGVLRRQPGLGDFIGMNKTTRD